MNQETKRREWREEEGRGGGRGGRRGGNGTHEGKNCRRDKKNMLQGWHHHCQQAL